MSRALITEGYLTDIADAIRAKNGSSDTYTPPQMAAAIAAIPTGGGGGSKNILSGTAMPTASDGEDGDIYLLVSKPSVKSDKSTYLNTGVIIGSDLEFEIEYITHDNIMKSDTQSNYGCIIGARYSSTSGEFQLTTYSNNGTSTHGSFGFKSSRYNVLMAKDTLQKFTFKNGTITDIYGNATSVSGTFTSTYPLYVFALNNGGSATQYGLLDLISLKLWKDETLVKDYAPAEVGGTACLHDAVSNGYEYPTSGTLTYDAGGSIISAYLKVDGSWVPLEGQNIDDVDRGLA